MQEDATVNWLKEMRKGYIRLIVLTLLSKKPYYGYEIMKEVKEKTRGSLRLTSGGVYRILMDLEESKYVQGEWGSRNRRKRKIYRITEAGMAILERALTKESQLADSMHDLFREYLTDVLNVKLAVNETPKTPTLFSMYLESRTEKPEDSIETLKGKSTEIHQMIKKLQKAQLAIRKRIAAEIVEKRRAEQPA